MRKLALTAFRQSGILLQGRHHALPRGSRRHHRLPVGGPESGLLCALEPDRRVRAVARRFAVWAAAGGVGATEGPGEDSASECSIELSGRIPFRRCSSQWRPCRTRRHERYRNSSQPCIRSFPRGLAAAPAFERSPDYSIYKPNNRGTGGVIRFGLNRRKPPYSSMRQPSRRSNLTGIRKSP